MAEHTNAETRDRRGAMRLDEERLTAFTKPRPLDEPRPFPIGERGRSVATAYDDNPEPAPRKQPFALEEPKPK